MILSVPSATQYVAPSTLMMPASRRHLVPAPPTAGVATSRQDVSPSVNTCTVSSCLSKQHGMRTTLYYPIPW